MGNSGSHSHHQSHHGNRHQQHHSSSGGGGGIPRYPYAYEGEWTHHHSLEGPESRNRLQRAYLPRRAYQVGHLPPPHKVLPQPVNPNKLLKATSNGAILHGGGTISGRKLAEMELEVNRKRSTMSCPGNGDGGMNSGRSTPNLLMVPRMGMTSAGMAPSSSSSRSRDYGSEPDLRDVGRSNHNRSSNQHHYHSEEDHDEPDNHQGVSSSPVPNSFTLIQESPAKKQIRSRKKSKAPPPPNPMQVQMLQAQMHIMQPTPIIPNNGFMGHPYQYRLQQDPQRQLLLAPVIANGNGNLNHHSHNPSPVSMEEKRKSRLFKTKAESKSAALLLNGTNSPKSRNELTKMSQAVEHEQNIKSSTENKENSRNNSKSKDSNPVIRITSSTSSNPSNQGGGGVKPPSSSSTSGNSNNINSKDISKVPNKNKPEGGGGGGKKTFYFGMDAGTFKQKKEDGESQKQTHVADIHKEVSRRKMLQKIEADGGRSPSPSKDNKSSNPNPTRNQNNASTPTKIVGAVVKPDLKKSNSNNPMSESDSDGVHRRQDSGSYDIKEKISHHKQGASNGQMMKINKESTTTTNSSSGIAKKKTRESSSDLSSSDLDMPLVVTRPTLPQKRPELPRFSPTAAWRAIDSPSRGSNNSGRSFEMDSSEDGRLQRFTRPSAPPRISAERSGDSGISAGDAGSPANPIALLEDIEVEDERSNRHPHHYPRTIDEYSPAPGMKKSSNKKASSSSSSASVPLPSSSSAAVGGGRMMMGSRQGADRMMKCWTPEQDLDESSSDFDQEQDPILPPVPPKPGKSGPKSKCNLFEGKRASAVVSDSDSKYYGVRSSHAASTDELNNPRGGGRLYYNKEGNRKMRTNHPAFNHRRPHGFVGLDANWFLSRSEPNSLNHVGIEDSYQDFRKTNNNKKQKQVIVGNRKAVSNGRDEFECELELDDEEFDSSDNSNHQNNNRNTTSSNKVKTKTRQTQKKLLSKSSEIGYGPSSMNFTSSSSYEDQEEGIDLSREEEEEESSEELMRDDLFDYLDQYEEGEFEREQEMKMGGNNEISTKNSNNNNKIMKDHNGVTTNGNKPFSHHIMYLPSYDARKVYNQQQNQWRRTRSVDHLDQPTLYKNSKVGGENTKPLEKVIIHNFSVESWNDRKISAPSHHNHQHHSPANISVTHISGILPKSDQEEEGQETLRRQKKEREEEERREKNRKKFKFQSTLRVMERKKIEEELSREAKHREEERLREIEEMKRVEEEFERKRKAKMEADARAKAQQQEEEDARREQFSVVFGRNKGKKPSSSNTPSSSPSPKPGGKGDRYKAISQRQEPEGAPASSSVSMCTSGSNNNPPRGDVRREIIINASKKRSANPVEHHTQELSEYRQEQTRQYCDYRSKASRQRQHSLSPARFMQKSSSSSDVFPMRRKKGPSSYSSKFSGSGRSSRVTTATVHPEVVCDIPVKPYPFVVNASRLGGSNTTVNLISEDRSSVLGSTVCPSSPSVISDNYRRDWAHHLTRGVNGRASSVMSLHSAPDNFKISHNNHNNKRPIESTRSNLSRQYSASPVPSSSSPVPSSTATDSFNQMSEKSSSRASPVRLMSRTSTTMISVGPQLKVNNKSASSTSLLSPSGPTSFHAQPYNNNRNKGYKPVAFKPPQPQATTAAVN